MVFLEVGMNAIRKGVKGDKQEFRAVEMAFEHAVKSCWAPLLEKKNRIDDNAAMRVTAITSDKIQKALISDVWGAKPIECVGELTNAMLAIAEDTHAQLPFRGAKDVGRLGAWSLMIDVCSQLCELTEGAEIDDRCYGIAVKIADLVRKEADA